MRFVFILAVIGWLSLALYGEHMGSSGSSAEFTVNLPHCEDGEWYSTGSDADSIKVACYQKDPIEPDDPERDR